jgi:hypothetical protein
MMTDCHNSMKSRYTLDCLNTSPLLLLSPRGRSLLVLNFRSTDQERLHLVNSLRHIHIHHHVSSALLASMLIRKLIIRSAPAPAILGINFGQSYASIAVLDKVC